MNKEITYYEVKLSVTHFHALSYINKKVDDIQVPLMDEDEETSANMIKYFDNQHEAEQAYELINSFGSISTMKLSLYKNITVYDADGKPVEITNEILLESLLTEE